MDSDSDLEVLTPPEMREDLYEDVDYGILSPQTKIKVKVNPSGIVILRADVQSDYNRRIPFFTTQRTVYNPLNQVFRVRDNRFK
ncbi:unnamed protein product [Phaedon cochleariae]|uniref:Uncharacterized protein n=1 Tax=Phaedon cochleariae TaxID=80249 RepID=A0A9N9SEB5_PHACE|nr:unnamed protein product [Phaedon cochleariae]